jgi:hypothetical protein
MAVQKRNFIINFSQGLETKVDPFQVGFGKFLNLENSVFSKGGMLQKRNGYKQLAELPSSSYNYLTTFNGDLTAVGTELTAYSIPTNQWVNKAPINPIELNTLSIIKNNTNQKAPDSVVAPNGLVCTVYVDQDPASLSTPYFKYVVADSNTGQNIIEPTIITGSNYVPKVFLLASYFVIVYPLLAAGVNHLYYIAISLSNPTIITSPIEISTQGITLSSYGLAFDGAVFNNTLYLGWNLAVLK